jgi:ABC-type transport system substrate-binding protein
MGREDPPAGRVAVWAASVLIAAPLACTNNPYPGADSSRKILYTTYREAPRTLDPAVAYTTGAHAVTGNVYDTLLEFHYLKRPYELIPALATRVPEPERRPGGRVAYRFELRRDLLFQHDPCFALGGDARSTREIVAGDLAFELMRIADPRVNSPVIEPFSNLAGFREFSQRLLKLREADPAFASLPAREQYAQAGGIEGARVLGTHELEIELVAPYPQILFWFAMPFTTPVPWEAVEYYDGEEGRAHFADHPVGSGPYVLAHYNKQARMVLEANPNWYGARHPDWGAPGATYPTQGGPEDEAKGLLDPDVVGRPLPFIERIEFQREKESIPAFNKFLQGYYDASGIIRESFDRVVREDALSPEMAALGMRLEKAVIPAVYYLGFNMDDPMVGRAAGEHGRKLRQAMSLAIDAEEWTRLFLNSRGVPAQSPLPPGLFGYDPDYRNPYRQVDLERARRLLEEAGHPDGIDPETGKPLRLTFDTYQTSAQGLIQVRFFVDAWRKIGIDVEIAATNYNQFQEKVRNGAYQIFMWGWVADYPDPENFFFLLWSEMARSKNEGPNTSNFSDPRFDELFLAMKSRGNDAKRLAVIRDMTAILERERPWIELFYPEDYAVYHGWLKHVKPFGISYPTIKYRDLNPGERARQRAAWNEPVVWPAWALLAVAIAITIPGIVTFYRERQ